jgi:hypothetical protein
MAQVAYEGEVDREMIRKGGGAGAGPDREVGAVVGNRHRGGNDRVSREGGGNKHAI